MNKKKTKLSKEEKKVFKLFKEINKKYEIYQKMFEFTNLNQSEQPRETPIHDWSTPLELFILPEDKNAILE